MDITIVFLILHRILTDRIMLDKNDPAQSLADTLNPAASGTFPGRADSIVLPEKPDVFASDTLRITLPASPAAERESVWDRIDRRDREINVERTESPAIRRQQAPAPQPAIIPVASGKTYKYDPSWYLDATNPFFREHVLPGREPDMENSAGRTVFIETITPGHKNTAAENYREYLEADLSGPNGNSLHYSGSWIPGMVILSLLLIAWIKMAYVQFLTPVLFSTFNYKEALKLYNSKNVPANNAFIILHLVFAVNSGLFLLFVAWHFNFNLPPLNPLLLFISSLSLLVILFAMKSAALRITGFLFDTPGFFGEYAHNISLYNKIFGILLMPLIVGLLYADPGIHGILIRVGLGLGIVIYLLQLVRGLEIIARKDFSLFYLILYLCAFEILPLCILYKLLDTFLI
jgi:hypothetical protein